MNTSALFATEWKYIDNTEAVTLFRKLSDSAFDGGTSVANAFSPGSTKEIGTSGKLLTANRTQFLLWQSQTGSPNPKIADVVQDGGGTRWTIWKVEVQAFGARFLCDVKQER